MPKEMSQFKISRTPEGVFAKEVNPYGEKAPERSTSVYDPDKGTGKIIDWQIAESQLQEYPLTEESQREKIWISSKILSERDPGWCIQQRTFEIGQIISGEIVMEDGIKKIKIC